MRLKFMAAIDTLATMENQLSSHIGTCFDADSPVAFDTKPTNAVRAKWNPVRVVAGSKWNHQISNDNKRERDREIGERTETKGETRSRHKLFIGHDDSNGADHIHCPGSHVGDR